MFLRFSGKRFFNSEEGVGLVVPSHVVLDVFFW
jgi:hypothetical protein